MKKIQTKSQDSIAVVVAPAKDKLIGWNVSITEFRIVSIVIEKNRGGSKDSLKMKARSCPVEVLVVMLTIMLPINHSQNLASFCSIGVNLLPCTYLLSEKSNYHTNCICYFPNLICFFIYFVCHGADS